MAYATSAAAAAEAVRLPGCCARPDGRGVLTEYRLALASAAASPALLGASPMSVALLFCERECPPAPASSLLAVALVRAAFSLSTDEAASTFASSMPELDVGHTRWADAVLRYVLCRTAVPPRSDPRTTPNRSFLDRLTWEAEAVRRALARALDDARRGGDAYPLRTALGLVARGAAECASRARDVVCQLLERCVASAAGQPDGQPLLGLPPFPPGGQLAAACAANAGATAACTRVLVACAAAVHRAKEESFRTTCACVVGAGSGQLRAVQKPNARAAQRCSTHADHPATHVSPGARLVVGRVCRPASPRRRQRGA